MAVKNVLFKIQADTAQLRRELDEVKKAIDGTSKAVQDTTKSVGGLGTILKGAAAAFGGFAVGDQIIQFGKGAIEAAGNYQGLQIAFETFLGSADKATAVLKDLQDFSALTPFTGEQVQQAGKALLAFGVSADDLKTTLTEIGDISAGTGKNFNELAVIYGKARTAGVLYAEDINQLVEAGIPVIEEFAKQLGTTPGQVKKLASDGKIGFDNLKQAFSDLTAEGGKFGGLTEKLSQSLPGRISTLKDNFEQLQRSVGEGLLPVFETLVDIGSSIVGFFSNLGTFAKENQTSFRVIAAAVALFATSLIRARTAALSMQAATALSAVRQRVANIQYEIGFIRLRILEATQGRLTIATKAGATATTIAKVAMEGFNAALKANPIGLILSALSLALPFLISFGDETEQLVEEQKKYLDTATALADVTEKSNDLIAQEQVQLDGLFQQLRKSNAGSAERKKLIDEINSKYGTTIQNLKDEKKFQALVNDEYVKAIKLIEAKAKRQAIEEELVELYKQERAIKKDIEKAQKQVANNQKQIDDQATKGKFRDVNQKTLDATKKLASGLIVTKDKTLDAALGFEDRLTPVLNETRNAIEKLKDEAGGLAITEIKPQVPPVNVPVKPTVDADKFLDDLKKELAKLENELATSSIEVKDVFTLEGELQKIDDLKKQTIKNIGETTDARIKEAEKEKKLSFEALTTLLEIELDQTILAERKAQQEKNKITKEYLEANAKAVEETNQVNAQRQLLIIQNLNDEIIKDNERLNKQLEKGVTGKRLDEIKKFQTQNRDTLVANYEFEKKLALDLAMAERDNALKNAKSDEERALAKANFALKAYQIEQSFAQKVQQINDQLNAGLISNEQAVAAIRKEGWKQIYNNAKELVNQITTALIQETDVAIEQQQKRVDAARKIAENGNAEILQLEEERLDKLNRQKARYVRFQQALAAAELVAYSTVAIAKAAAEGGPAAPFTIAATLIALASGLIAAKLQAQNAIAGFETGGYTGDGGRKEAAGIVHKGEFVFTQEKTKRYRSLFEDIHRGRDPFLTKDVGSQVIVVNNHGMDDKLARIEKAIQSQNRMSLSIDERGIHGIVSTIDYKNRRIRNKAK